MPFRELAGALIVDPPGVAVDRSAFVDHRVDQPDAGAARRVMRTDDPGRSFIGLQPAPRIPLQRPLVAGDRATDLSRRRDRALARDQSELQAHPMHLHGFYFDVDSLGDGMRDRPIAPVDGIQSSRRC